MNIIEQIKKPIFFILFLMLLVASNSNATLYKWGDKKERIQFSDKKPLTIKAVNIVFDTESIGHIYKGKKCNQMVYTISWNDMEEKLLLKKQQVKKQTLV